MDTEWAGQAIVSAAAKMYGTDVWDCRWEFMGRWGGIPEVKVICPVCRDKNRSVMVVAENAEPPVTTVSFTTLSMWLYVTRDSREAVYMCRCQDCKTILWGKM